MRADIGGIAHLLRDTLREARKVLPQFLGHFGERSGRPPQFAGDGI